MKYLHENLEQRFNNACKLTNKKPELSQDLYQAYKSRITKLNELLDILPTKKNKTIIPTSRELDSLNIISSRTIQRSLGGLKFFRAFMQGEAILYSNGTYRSKTASLIGQRSQEHEQGIYDGLVKQYGFLNVQPQRPYIIGKGHRCDFYIVLETDSKGQPIKDMYIDVFYSDYPTQNILRMKRKKLEHLPSEIKQKIYYINNDNKPQRLFDFKNK